MGTHAAVGRSVLGLAGDAAREATRQAVDGLGGRVPRLLLVFATTAYDQRELLETVAAEAGTDHIAGCTGEGVIALRDSIETEHALAVCAIASEAIDFEILRVERYAEDPAARGRQLAEWARRFDDAIGLWLFVDGLVGDCTSFLNALQAGLPPGLPVVGGTSADSYAFVKCFQYAGTSASSDAVVGVLLRGQATLEIAVSHGCTAVGRPRAVTKAEGGWVHEIDGRSAWSVFREYLDGEPTSLNAEGIVHLCIGEELTPGPAEAYAPYVIRTPLSLDQATGALFFPGGSLRVNQRIQLTRRDPGRIKASARACADRILDRHPGRSPSLVLQFDCAGRGRIMFGPDAASVIVHPLQEALGTTVPWIGFHTYGEIAPIEDQLYYHNYTVALCAVYDDARRSQGPSPS